MYAVQLLNRSWFFLLPVGDPFIVSNVSHIISLNRLSFESRPYQSVFHPYPQSQT